MVSLWLFSSKSSILITAPSKVLCSNSSISLLLKLFVVHWLLLLLTMSHSSFPSQDVCVGRILWILLCRGSVSFPQGCLVPPDSYLARFKLQFCLPYGAQWLGLLSSFSFPAAAFQENGSLPRNQPRMRAKFIFRWRGSLFSSHKCHSSPHSSSQ